MNAEAPPRIVDPSVAEGGEAALRPARLMDFVGQKAVRENLAVFVEAALADGGQLGEERSEAQELVAADDLPGGGQTFGGADRREL